MSKSQLVERTIGGVHGSLLKEIMKISEIGHNTPILDIGCGTGAWLETLAWNGYRNLRGVDIDTEQFATNVAVCSQINLNIDDDLGLGNKKFGLITAIEVIEHLENPGRLFYHINKHLEEKGYFLMTTPNIHSVLCRFRFLITGKLKQFDDKGDQTHVYPVLLTALDRILPRYQLEIVSQWSYPPNGSSKTSRRSLTFAVTVLKLFLQDSVPGDILCLLIRKRAMQHNSTKNRVEDDS